MSQLLEMPDSVFQRLRAAADASGTTPLGWIEAQLDPTSAKQRSSEPALIDLFRGKIGLFNSAGCERLSENCGERYAADLEAMRREGHS